jgi:hypothetical protein
MYFTEQRCACRELTVLRRSCGFIYQRFGRTADGRETTALVNVSVGHDADFVNPDSHRQASPATATTAGIRFRF